MKQIIIQKEKDRVIYFFEDGINYNMDCRIIDLKSEVCKELTYIYKTLLKRHDFSEKKFHLQLIEVAIEIYNQIHIYIVEGTEFS